MLVIYGINLPFNNNGDKTSIYETIKYIKNNICDNVKAVQYEHNLFIYYKILYMGSQLSLDDDYDVLIDENNRMAMNKIEDEITDTFEYIGPKIFAIPESKEQEPIMINF